jgi:ketosteroid isomerase-like protein
MSAADHDLTTQPQGQLPLRAAMEARDLAAVTDSFAPDAVLRSPLTGRLTFSGRDQIATITRVILEVFQDFHYTDELRSGDTAVLIARARVGGQDLETASTCGSARTARSPKRRCSSGRCPPPPPRCS